MKIFRARYVVGSLALIALSACSTPPKPVDLSNPSGTKTALVPDAQHAVLVLKSNGQPMIVNFSEVDSKGVKNKIGSVFDTSDMAKELLPSILRMITATNRTVYGALPMQEVLIDASAPMRLVGHSTWSDTTGSRATGLYTRSGSCGPLNNDFQPQPMRRYMARFSFTGRGCVQQIFDITEAESVLVSGAPLPMPAK
ncbi:hypothetical protein FXN63_05085 [Pigmentiphaga aceris]|uniref:Uncharacterized protein n=1 Tax=Pigmentiphaga aceris TaxID=1940612 RepID=A0A5C0ASM8_9BURK|nr:hypothetical protein [Pigmentiphaga aceris]QEI05282.1 hypothetical protein FXN63_05085 [Pigmentiphaga aceris]